MKPGYYLTERNSLLIVYPRDTPLSRDAHGPFSEHENCKIQIWDVLQANKTPFIPWHLPLDYLEDATYLGDL